jgi:hypothetical protein
VSTAVSFEKVRKLALQFPSVEESTSYGKPSLKVHGKMFVCMASHKSAEPDSLVVRVDFEQRAELLCADAATYYITEHYEDYPAVLVRLARVEPDVLRDLIGMAYRIVSGEVTRKGKGKGKGAAPQPIKTRKR